MTLRRFAPDERTAAGVKSSFTINIPDPYGPILRDPSKVPSDICGWGWRFSCSLKEISRASSRDLSRPPSRAFSRPPSRPPSRAFSRPPSRASSPTFSLAQPEPPSNWEVTVYFHPDLIRGAGYGQLTFRTSVENLHPVEDELDSTTFNLPDRTTRNPTLGAYYKLGSETALPKISISVEFTNGLGMALPQLLDARVERALAETIRGEDMVDTKFYAYSRVGPSYVARPRAMFAKMSMLRGHSDILDAYLAGISQAGFAESQRIDLDTRIPEERFAGYDYLSDSDLDTDDEEDDVPSTIRSGSLPGRSNKAPANSVPVSDSAGPPVPRRMGHVIVVKGHAYKTWNAFLYYMYTKNLAFRTSGSLSDSESGSASTSATPKCSAKSMYKLADAFGLTDLKGLALAAVRSQLSAENIVRETFSRFTSWYPEVQDIEVQFLIQHLPDLKEEMKEMLKSVCEVNCLNVLHKIVCRTAPST
ncbi:hypothetical protein B0H11DRAFT_2056938 [Mycena galericulata]|nr:hypothetical protein B0H11DRAFT_2056938 [Mycena galericulata]